MKKFMRRRLPDIDAFRRRAANENGQHLPRSLPNANGQQSPR
jgi:hypothetical protein